MLLKSILICFHYLHFLTKMKKFSILTQFLSFLVLLILKCLELHFLCFVFCSKVLNYQQIFTLLCLFFMSKLSLVGLNVVEVMWKAPHRWKDWTGLAKTLKVCAWIWALKGCGAVTCFHLLLQYADLRQECIS